MCMNSTPNPQSGRFKDIAGQTFGRLTVTQELGRDSFGRVTWSCRCVCGQVVTVGGANLRSGTTKSCGCLRLEALVKAATKHGLGRSPEVRAWYAMWERCTNVNGPAYQWYRLRSPPEEWRDFKTFYSELGPRPTPKHSLDRIENSKPYGPGNCRWATAAEQNANRKSSVRVVFQGEEMCLKEGCLASGVPYWWARKVWRITGSVEAASLGLLAAASRLRT